jgi:FlgD Ig-like domain
MRLNSANRRLPLAMNAIISSIILVGVPSDSIQSKEKPYSYEVVGFAGQIHDMNDKGEFLYSFVGAAVSYRLYLPAPAYGFPAGSVFLPALDGTNSVRLVAINNSGLVVGESAAGDGTMRLTIWENGTPIDLEPPNSSYTQARGINNLGHIIGTVTPVDRNVSAAFLYDGSQFQDLQPAGQGYDTCYFSGGFPNDINNSDVMVGTWSCSPQFGNSEFDEYIWQGASASELPHPNFRGVDINDKGQIAGYLNVLPSPFTWGIYENGSVTTFPKIRDSAFNISNGVLLNDSGHVFGGARIIGSNNHDVAFIWLRKPAYGLAAGMYDLNDLVDLPSISLIRPKAIANTGLLAVGGFSFSLRKWLNVILTPNKAGPPTDIAVNAVGDESDTDPGDGACLTASGDCTLRAAIEESNALAGVDTIKFNLPGTSIPTIQPVSEFPEITDPVVIDGSTQPITGLIEIDGSMTQSANGLTISAGNSQVTSLVIGNFDGDGLALLTGDSNVVSGLYIGVDPNRVQERSNSGHGIIIINSDANIIGEISSATTSSSANSIAHNGRAGVFVSIGVGNIISRNSIYANGALGIDLAPEGVTANDTLDLDIGANGLVNFPIIDSVVTALDGVGVDQQGIWGRVSGAPNMTYMVELFSNGICDVSLYGEGEQFVDTVTVTTDAFGLGEFALRPVSYTLDTLSKISATATDTFGNTSEFSQCWPRTKKLLLVDGKDNPILQKSFVVSHANYDPPAHTETILDTLFTDNAGFLDLSRLYGLGRISIGDSIKISKLLSLKRNDVKDPTVRLDNGKFDSLSYGLKYDTVTTDTVQIVKLDHSTFGFAFEVAIEWDATREYIDSVRSGMRQMANYLYDLTDGQALLDYVFIAEKQGRKEWTGPFNERPVGVLIVADNTQVPNVEKGSQRVVFPRRFFLYGDAANQSAEEDPSNPADMENWRELMPALAEQLFGFESERKFFFGFTCDSKKDLGFMGWAHPQFADRGANSEMSTSLNYFEYPGCKDTWQFKLKGMSCWDYFQKIYEGVYPPDGGGIFAPVIMPTERFLPAPEFYFRGPNEYDPVDEKVNLQYDAASRLFIDGDNSVSPAFDEFWELTDIGGAPLAGIGVTVIKPTAPGSSDFGITIQGKTSDSGGIWLVGVEDGDFVAASGLLFVSSIDSSGEIQPVSRWVNGQAIITAPGFGVTSRGVANTLVLTPIAGDFPSIVSATLDSSSFDFTLDVTRTFVSPPTVGYLRDSVGLVSQELIPSGLHYQTQVEFGAKQTGQIEVKALDDSSNTFSFGARYNVSGADASLGVNTATSADASVEFVIDEVNNNIEKMMVVSSPFTIIRGPLNPLSVKAGQTHSLSVWPATSLNGENSITINYNLSDFSGIAGAFTNPLTLTVHHWNSASGRWEALISDVDTSATKVQARISEAGVYALFTSDIQTDVDDDEIVTLPKRFKVHQNYPNPFNPTTVISYSLPMKAEVTISIYNVLGQRVTIFDQGQQSAGEHSVTWDATDKHGKAVASGMYFYKVTAEEFSASRKMVLLK